MLLRTADVLGVVVCLVIGFFVLTVFFETVFFFEMAFFFEIVDFLTGFFAFLVAIPGLLWCLAPSY